MNAGMGFKLSHLQAMLLFALLISIAFGFLSRRKPIERVKYIVWSLFLFLLFGVAIGWRCIRSHGESAFHQRKYRSPIPRAHRRSRPRRMPIATASARVEAPSLPRMEATWNLAVWSEMASRAAISLFPSPLPSI